MGVAAVQKISISNFCKSFNQEIQADFTFSCIKETRYCVLRIVYLETGYSKACTKQPVSDETVRKSIKTVYSFSHGVSASFFADREFTQENVRMFFTTHNINFNELPVRHYNKMSTRKRNIEPSRLHSSGYKTTFLTLQTPFFWQEQLFFQTCFLKDVHLRPLSLSTDMVS